MREKNRKSRKAGKSKTTCMTANLQQRVFAYIDGFNLHFGLRDAGFHRYYWLNLQALAAGLLKPGQRLVCTKYFTARVSGGRRGDPQALAKAWEEKRKRQSLFLEAVATLPDLQTFEGHFLSKTVECRNCGGGWRTHEEKMTDVRIATEMLTDAFADSFDVALLISADSDLVPPVSAIRSLFPRKRIIAAFPPKRSSEQLKKAVNGWLAIGEDKLRQSLFPDRIRKPDGFLLERPAKWR
jgi:uncharacterized LabA/DUF88 family protein